MVYGSRWRAKSKGRSLWRVRSEAGILCIPASSFSKSGTSPTAPGGSRRQRGRYIGAHDTLTVFPVRIAAGRAGCRSPFRQYFSSFDRGMDCGSCVACRASAAFRSLWQRFRCSCLPSCRKPSLLRVRTPRLLRHSPVVRPASLRRHSQRNRLHLSLSRRRQQARSVRPPLLRQRRTSPSLHRALHRSLSRNRCPRSCFPAASRPLHHASSWVRTFSIHRLSRAGSPSRPPSPCQGNTTTMSSWTIEIDDPTSFWD
jgi:hypothetical protein